MRQEVMALVNSGCPQTVWTPAYEDAVSAVVEQEPWRSSRYIAREFGLSQLRVQEYVTVQNGHANSYPFLSSAFGWLPLTLEISHALQSCLYVCSLTVEREASPYMHN
jgi:hypothetical protein